MLLHRKSLNGSRAAEKPKKGIYKMKIVAFTQAEANGTFAQDVPLFADAIKASGADIVLAPATSRFKRSMPAAAIRAGADIDTNVTDVTIEGDAVKAQRWVYRQRILATFTRTSRPWVILTDPALFNDIAAKLGVAEKTEFGAGSGDTRTVCNGVQAAGNGGESTIRPDANLLFVAGAGWTKKQADGAMHLTEAASAITTFLSKSGASLGSSKSLVDMPEAAEALSFMSHMNQVGQTGSTPRHAKGLSTCCHGEEPHVVGWRFINERRAINLDANCGWAQGKADVVYVADAFEVMKKVNELM
jgi:electron transfer flavoprotein alpha subunit